MKKKEVLISRETLAKKVGISPPLLRYHLIMGYIPVPTITIGKRQFYSADQAKEVETYFSRLLSARVN